MLLWEPIVGIEEMMFKHRPKYWVGANQEKCERRIIPHRRISNEEWVLCVQETEISYFYFG